MPTRRHRTLHQLCTVASLALWLEVSAAPRRAQEAEDPYAKGGPLEGRNSEDAPAWHGVVEVLVLLACIGAFVAFTCRRSHPNGMDGLITHDTYGHLGSVHGHSGSDGHARSDRGED